jgi:tripartite-type tricarboxylate transporter receptor subunit TctC
MSGSRLKYLPYVPTFKELGIDIEFMTWRGISVPKDTPDEIVEVLKNGFLQAALDSHFKDIMARLWLGYRLADAQDFEKNIKESDEFYKTMIEELKNNNN